MTFRNTNMLPENPVEKELSKLAEQIYKSPKVFIAGMSHLFTTISPPITEADARGFRLHWINSDNHNRLPFAKEFKSYLKSLSHRNEKKDDVGCKYGICEGSGYITVHLITDGVADDDPRMGKHCKCCIGEQKYKYQLGLHFLLAPSQENEIKLRKSAEIHDYSSPKGKGCVVGYVNAHTPKEMPIIGQLEDSGG